MTHSTHAMQNIVSRQLMLLGGKGVDEPLDASNVKKSIELVGVEGKDNNYVERSSTRPSI